MRILLGNVSPMMTKELDDGSYTYYRAEHLEQSVTRVETWDGVTDPEFVERSLSTNNDRMLALIGNSLADEHRNCAVLVREVEDVLAIHANSSNPAWVACADPVVQAALAAHYKCAQGEPTMGILTNAGRDALHAQHLSTSAQPAAFYYGGISANTGSGFAATDTTLAGEITTAGGGLIRGAMTYAHTAGTNTSTLTKTYTANGSDTLPVTIASWANFNASTAGTMGEESALSSTATLNVSGDSVTVTFTLTAG